MTAMAATAEELELQEQVAKALESQGVLGKIKAQLRVAVFQAIHGNGDRSGLLASRPSLSTVLSPQHRLQALGADGQVALEIVRNFLECLELEHTLTVLVAETNLGDGRQSEWRQPSRLCERVGVINMDEQTPVLVKMVQRGGQGKTLPVAVLQDSLAQTERRPVETLVKADSRRDGPAPKLNLPPPPFVASSSLNTDDTKKEEEEGEEQREAELDASIAEEVASGSFDDEALADSASLSHSLDHERGDRSTASTTQRPDRLEMNDEDDEDDESPAIASPPPVPAKLGAMPPLSPMSMPSKTSKAVRKEESDDQEEEEDDEDQEDDEADAADRLRSLEAKLKLMEAEDDTGVLQQLKVSKLEEPDATELDKSKYDDKSEKDGQEEEDDNYGSDFEEVEEDMDDDVGSELSEDIASTSVLSESEEVSVAKAKPGTVGFQHDTPVDNEHALNSYDYIEAVERD